MGAKVGLTCKLYLNTSVNVDPYAVPRWEEVTLVRDLNLNLDKGVAEVKARLSTWVQNLPTLKSGPVEYGIIADRAVTFPLVAASIYNTLRDAYLAGTVLDFAVADGAIATSGTEYFRADYQISGFKRGEPLEEVATVDITMNLNYSSHTPGFTTV